MICPSYSRRSFGARERRGGNFMWHKLSLSALLALIPLAGIAQPPDYPRRRPPPIPRQEREFRPQARGEVWRYFANGGGTFQRVRGRQWAENRNYGEPIYYREVARTSEYVELFDEGR